MGRLVIGDDRRIASARIEYRIFEDAEKRSPVQVSASLRGKTLQPRENTQGLSIALKNTIALHAVGQGDLAAMTEGRVPKIMCAAYDMNHAAFWQISDGGGDRADMR